MIRAECLTGHGLSGDCNMPLPRTYVATPKDIEKNWFVIDAADLVLGRLASLVAMRVRGKHKPTYTPNMDCGDHIIIVNPEKVRLTGKKWSQKTYYWHTGYPGGIKETTPEKVLEGKFPGRVLELAVKRMLPRGPLGRRQLSNMRVYAGTEHPHEAQAPETLDVAAMNAKNIRG